MFKCINDNEFKKLQIYLDQEGGDLTLALGRYNGTRGQWHYPERVLQAAARWRNEHD